MKNLHRILAGIVLVAGLAGSGLIYLTTPENAREETLGFSAVNDPSSSKMYEHDLRVFGGKANVYTDEFIRWFAGLWHGKSLAYTVACLTVFVSVCSFYFADLLFIALKADIPDHNH